MAATPLPLRALLTVVAFAALTVACTPLPPTEPTQDITAVDYVLDGDTIEVTGAAGSSQRVRLLGINTPEVALDDEPGQCGGEAAAEQLRTLLPEGTTVQLVSDPEADDEYRYGRLLRYVELEDGTDVGAALIAAGYAYAWAPLSEPASTRTADYEAATATARDAGAGSWSTCPHLDQSK
ncbi:thermonuclease family protein [Brachybacterium paraconglomeratum]|uniref:thermonuclease family protein n=1 Tax=Brachybacterium paraconglomeratum TaxID=173362 RepID=UPI0022E5E12E|nr:thermonuclease family protein [Brachybacterium paraconglomeratum]